MTNLVSSLRTASAVVLAIALFCPPTAPAQEPSGPPPSAGETKTADPVVAPGVASLKLGADNEWTSSGLTVRKGERVRVRAWGRVKIASAGGTLADPNGLASMRGARLVTDAPAAMLVGVVGERGNDYIKIGKDADFVAPADGVLYFCLNQVDPAGNEGEFDVRVAVGHASSLSFNTGTGLLPPPDVASPRDSAGDVKVVTVSPTLDWTNTYIAIERGDVVEVDASGRVFLDLSGRASGPEGISAADPGKLLADRPTGALIAVVGVDNNDFIFLGAKGRFTAERSGLLFLGINEEQLANNSGGYTARVRVIKN